MNRYATIPDQRSHMNGGIFILILMALILLVYAVIQVQRPSDGHDL